MPTHHASAMTLVDRQPEPLFPLSTWNTCFLLWPEVKWCVFHSQPPSLHHRHSDILTGKWGYESATVARLSPESCILLRCILRLSHLSATALTLSAVRSAFLLILACPYWIDSSLHHHASVPVFSVVRGVVDYGSLGLGHERFCHWKYSLLAHFANPWCHNRMLQWNTIYKCVVTEDTNVFHMWFWCELYSW